MYKPSPTVLYLSVCARQPVPRHTQTAFRRFQLYSKCEKNGLPVTAVAFLPGEPGEPGEQSVAIMIDNWVYASSRRSGLHHCAISLGVRAQYDNKTSYPYRRMYGLFLTKFGRFLQVTTFWLQRVAQSYDLRNFSMKMCSLARFLFNESISIEIGRELAWL